MEENKCVICGKLMRNAEYFDIASNRIDNEMNNLFNN